VPRKVSGEVGVDSQVETASGRLSGRLEEGVHVFRGVPYASPPVGSRRFRPPVPPEPWAGVRDATRASASAPQKPGIIAGLLAAGVERSDEDCLSLNVWTPALDAGRRPVLVWLHGGSYLTGSGSLPLYEGRRLAQRGDVVVVTLNYRLGALGWLALPALAAEEGGALGNLGLLDQIAALEWVRDHIAFFGGDPDWVTLFGESAGAMSVGALLGVPRARGLFGRAILQSGAAANVHDRDDGVCVAETFMKEMGLAPGDVSGLRAAPVKALIEAQERCGPALAWTVPGLAFQPVVDGDVLPRQPLDSLSDPSWPALPILIGSNRDEWKLYGIGDRRARDLDEAALLRRCQRNLPGEDASGRSRAERVIETYRRARAGRAGVSPPDLWFAIESDRHFRYPAMRLAEINAMRQADTYAYFFTWESPALGGALGSCHAIEVPFVFGCIEDGLVPKFVGRGPAVSRLSQEIQDAWISFARSGRPGHPGPGDWPTYEATRRATLVLGEQTRIEHAPLETERALWADLEG